MKDKAKYQTSPTAFSSLELEKGDIWFWVMTGSICKGCKLQVSSFPWSPCFGGSLVFLTWNQVDLTKYLKTASQDPSSLNRNWVKCVVVSPLDFYSLYSEKPCFYLQYEYFERAVLLLKSWPSWCIILRFFFLGLIWTHCHLKSNQISQFQVIRIFFLYLKSVLHPWLTRGTMDKTSSPKSSFSVKQCQPLAALPFGLNWMGFTRDCRRILGQDEVSECDSWSWILGLDDAQFHRSECYEFCAVVVLSCLAHGESLAPSDQN